jgi:hypothetical protein
VRVFIAADDQSSKPTQEEDMRSRALTIAVAAVAAAVLAAGCGGSSPGSTVANVGSAPAKTSTGPAASGGDRSPAAFFSQALKFSACMRSHGLPDFPDPQQNGHGISLSIHASKGSDLNPNSPQFQAAQRACRAYAPKPPSGGAPNPQLQRQALAFAQCMRSHGVPNFPDPKVSGNSIQIGGPGKQGFDPNSPQFRAAQQACQAKLPGAGGGGTLSSGSGSSGK